MFGFVTPPKKTSRYLPGSPLAMADSADDGNIPEKKQKRMKNKTHQQKLQERKLNQH